MTITADGRTAEETAAREVRAVVLRAVLLPKQKNKKILKQKVKDGELTKTIYAPKQELHYQGTKQHEDYTKTHGGIEKSYFTVPISELQSILDEKFATGRVHIFSDGKITEIFDCGKIVGYDTLLKRETSFVKVHYSKLKTHMVPHVKNG